MKQILQLKYYCIALLIIVFSFGSCTREPLPCGSPSHMKQYIHLAHTRLFDTISQRIEPILEVADYSPYDMILLGGDLTEETSKSEKTVEYIDGIFDLASPNTLWALGNHDNANLDYVTKATGRPITYAKHKNGITYLVLDTQEDNDWDCWLRGEQLKMFNKVADTIKNSSHLVLLTHKLIWIRDNPGLAQHQGVGKWDWACNYMVLKSTNWNQDYLPRLRELRKKGIKIICLAGDIGNNVKSFEEHTKDGITYLASGIHSGDDRSKALIFNHNVKTRNLWWSFVPISEL